MKHILFIALLIGLGTIVKAQNNYWASTVTVGYWNDTTGSWQEDKTFNANFKISTYKDVIVLDDHDKSTYITKGESTRRVIEDVIIVNWAAMDEKRKKCRFQMATDVKNRFVLFTVFYSKTYYSYKVERR